MRVEPKGGICVSKKGKKSVSQKDKTDNLISKWAFCILFALTIEILVYLVVLNLVPTMVKKTVTDSTELAFVNANSGTMLNNENDAAVLNPFYHSNRYYTSNGAFLKTIDNPTWLIYDYNMILLAASIILVMFYLVNLMEHSEKGFWKTIKKFLMEQWPFLILLTFMVWVFISSCFAGDTYRSFIGCYNLKDGFFSFLMYGSMLVCSMLLIKNQEKYRKVLVNTFLITATILAVLTLWNYHVLTASDLKLNIYAYDRSYVGSTSPSVGGARLITWGEPTEDGKSLQSVYTIGELLFGNGGLPRGNHFLVVVKRVLGENNSSVFHNSNHYGYYLSICVMVAAVMALKAKKTWQTVLYYASYCIMLTMAILNNTFGCYLGIGASLLLMIVYALIPKKDSKEEEIPNNSYGKELIVTLILVCTFALLSMTVVNDQGENIVKNNFATIASDISLFLNRNQPNGNENLTEQPAENGETSTKLEEKVATSDTVSDISVVEQKDSYQHLIIYLVIGSIAFFAALIPQNKLRQKIGEERYQVFHTRILIASWLILLICLSIVRVRANKIATYDAGLRKAGVSTEQSSEDNVSEIGSGRGKLWYRGIHLAMQRPFFGWGLENIIYQYGKQFGIGEGRSHNLIVQLSATTGVVGMLLYVAGIASLWIRKLRTIKTWNLYECLGMFVIVSYMISSFVGNSSFYASPYFYIFVGFAILSNQKNNN